MNDVVEGKIIRRGDPPMNMMAWSCSGCSEPWQAYVAQDKALATCCRCGTFELIQAPGATVHDWRSCRSSLQESLTAMNRLIGIRKPFPWEVQDRAMYQQLIAMIEAHIGPENEVKMRRVRIEIEPATFAKVLGLTGDLSYYRTEI